MITITLTLTVITLLVSIYTLHKVRRTHLMTFKLQSELNDISAHASNIESARTEMADIYRQLQAYQDLQALIKPIAPFPPLRGWAASPDFLLEICRHTLRHRPETIIECSSGATTVALARCCELNEVGHVISLEHDPFYAEQTHERLLEHGLDRWATIIHAPLIPQAEVGHQPWYSLQDIPLAHASCELLIIDGPPGDSSQDARHPALPLLANYLSPNCTIFLDDAKRPAEQSVVRRWLEDFPDFHLDVLECEKGCARLTRSSAPIADEALTAPSPTTAGLSVRTM